MDQYSTIPVVYDPYGNLVYPQQQDNTTTTTTSTTNAPAQNHPNSGNNTNNNNGNLRYDSIGSLAPLTSNNPNSTSINSIFGMIKTDSHAVLMELFARDQDLVRQAAAGKAIQAAAAAAATQGSCNPKQHSVTFGPTDNTFCFTDSSNNDSNNNGPTYNAPPSSSLSSWPHFSSVSSLNNLGHGLPGVKSITNLSAADLSSQGNLNKMGNLAQVKSIENMVCSSYISIYTLVEWRG